METGQRGKKTWHGAERWQWQQNGPSWSHIYVWWIKIRRDTLGASFPGRRPELTAQGSITSSCENQWGLGQRTNFWVFRKLHLKGLHCLKTYTNPPTLRFNTKATAGRPPVACREWVK